MNAKTYLLPILFSLLISGYCQSGGQTPVYTPLPESFRRSGMISSSTYQVYFTVNADSHFEAKHQGEPRGRKRAYELLVNEPFIPRYPSYKGKLRLEQIIRTQGKVVRTNQVSDDTFEVVFHIHKVGLRQDFQKIW